MLVPLQYGSSLHKSFHVCKSHFYTLLPLSEGHILLKQALLRKNKWLSGKETTAEGRGRESLKNIPIDKLRFTPSLYLLSPTVYLLNCNAF